MNPSIKKLVECSERESRKIIGLMSGTSLDGLDMALTKIIGRGENTKVEQLQFITRPYDAAVKNELKKITSLEQVSLRDICYQHAWLAGIHSGYILDALVEWGLQPADIDCIASHGQTIYHMPARDTEPGVEPINSTLQIADGDHIAAKTGILTISDFRQKHIANGGEGAPMAGLVDHILFSDDNEHRIMLNIGGIGNFTWLPAKAESTKPPFTTDTGPGNTLIDKWVQEKFDLPYDKDSQIALSGNINPALVEALLKDHWFNEKKSKTTGPEYFSLDWMKRRAKNVGIDPGNLPPEDVTASLTELSAFTLSESISNNIADKKDVVVYVSGGGAHNPFLIQRLKVHLSGIKVRNFSELGFDPDAKEAIIFAVLANEMIAGDGFYLENTGGNKRKVNFGKLSFPE